MTGRREFLWSLGGLAGVLLGGGLAWGATERSIVGASGGAGAPRGSGGPRSGRGLELSVETRDGQPMRVEVLRADPSGRSPAPVAQVGEIAVYVDNGGNGKTRTPPEVREAAEAFAKILAERRLPPLPTFAERVIR